MEVGLLGPLVVRSGGRTVPLGARLERALLTVLVLEAGRVVPADRIVDLLWPESPPPKAVAALHTKVAHLRRALEPDRAPRGGPSVIVTAAPGYRLDRDGLALDADRFEALVGTASAEQDPATARALVEKALALWRGPALGEFADDPFARPAAERLETLRLAAVELHARALLDLGETDRAVAELRRHVTDHPLREQARAQLARALYLAGQQAAALGTLTEGRRLLRDELGLDPGPGLRRLEEQILGHDPRLQPRASARHPHPSPGPALHGRDAERTQLVRRVEEAAGGAGSVVLLTGDAGMGKSALLELLRDTVADRRGVHRWATCRNGLAAPPFWPVLQMVREAAGDIDAESRARLGRALGPLRDTFPDLVDDAGPTAGGVDPAMVVVHLSAALELAAGRGLSLLVFDDVHLADPATLALLGSLAGRVHRSRTVLGLALRSGEGGSPAMVDLLGTLSRLPRALRLDLGPLPRPAIEELVRARATVEAAGLDPRAVGDIADRAAGNPFFAVELARAAVADSTERGRAAGVPPPIVDVLRERILRLPEPAPDLLAAGTVAGGAFLVDDVAAVCDVPVDEALDALEAALAARLLTDTGEGRFALAHALLGDALLASLSSARLARLHRAFGDRLAARSGTRDHEASRIAHHYLAARSLDGGAAALPWLERAADHAVSLSALTQLRELAQETLAVLADLEADPHRRHELRARGRIAFADVWSVGHDCPAVREYIRLMRAWTVPTPPEPDDMELLWMATVFENQVGRVDQGNQTVARMAELADRLDDDTARWLHLDMAGAIRWMSGRYADALDLLDEAERVVARGRVDLHRSLSFSPPTRIALVRGLTLWQLGDRAAARASTATALRIADAAGLGAAGFARRWALMLALMDGDPGWVRALVDRQPAEPSWERYRYPSAVVAFAEGWLATLDGDRPGGLAAMRAAHATLVEQGLSGGRTVLLGLLAEATLAAGDPREADALCEAGLAIAERGEKYWVPRLEQVREAARQPAASGPQATSSTVSP